MNQPQIEIDDLTQPGAAQYWLHWTQGNVLVMALLERAGDSSDYRLDCWYDSLKRIGAERLGRKQHELGEKLLPLVRARMVEAMLSAGWQETEGTWRLLERTEQVTVTEQGEQSKVLSLASKKGTRYSRTIITRDVTLTCKECGQQVTRTVYPGAHPQYCEDCAEKIEKQKRNARRMKSYYAHQARKS